MSGRIFQPVLPCSLPFSLSRVSCFLAVVLTPWVSAQEKPSVIPPLSPVPEWVDDVPLDLATPFEADPNHSRDGLLYRLIDIQKNPEENASFFRYADEFLTTGGLQADAEIILEYDPDYETLQLHRVVIHRDGQQIDGLKNALIREITPEDELQSAMLHGHRSILIFPADLRPGDTLEYAYSVQGAHPYFNGHFFDEIELDWENYVLHTRYRLVKNRDRPLFRQNRNTLLRPAVKDLDGGLQEWVWEARNLRGVIAEENLPAWYDPYQSIEISELETWAEVAALGRKHYQFPVEEIGPDLKAVVDRIRSTHDSESERVTAAIRFVQDEIRYLGIEEGRRAYVPVSPNITLERRFGDCKDKTLLLQTILAALEVNSSPVYTDIDAGIDLNRLLPSPLVFDHVVSRIELSTGDEIFCDCTSTHVGGLAGTNLTFPKYDHGLVLFDENADLRALPVLPVEENRTLTKTEVFPGELGEPAKIHIMTEYSGRDADSNRFFADTESARKTERDFLNYYRTDYGSMKVISSPEIQDDRDQNRFCIDETYEILEPWRSDSETPEWNLFTVYFRDIRDHLAAPVHPFRSSPFAIHHPKNVRNEVKIYLPNPEAWEFEDQLFSVESAGFTLRREVTFKPDEGYLEIVAEFHTRADHVDPGDLEEHIEAINSAYELTRYELWNLDEEAASQSGMIHNDDGKEKGATTKTGASNSKPAGVFAWGAVVGLTFGTLLAGGVFLVLKRSASPARMR